MQTYVVRLNCLSPYLTPWRNCTIWGRLSWIVAGERLPGWDIDTWARRYAEDRPALVVGDAFPYDAVPVPALYQTAAGDRKPPKMLPWLDWLNLCETGAWPKETRKHERQLVERMHVVMSRETDSSAGGGLRTEVGEQPREGLILVALVDESLGEQGLKQLFTELCEEGWGQGRTHGYGHIELESITSVDRPANTAWSVTLGHCHPTDNLPQDGFWRWAGVPVRPHDKTTRRGERQLFTTMLLPGASFQSGNEMVGRVIEWPARHDYQHYGVAPAWPLRNSVEKIT